MVNSMTIKHLCGVLCVFLIVTEIVTGAPSYSDYGNNIRELYELLLQNDALEQRLGEHQMIRKANRSPSLRLRFGKRFDPSLLPVSDYFSAQEQEQN